MSDVKLGPLVTVAVTDDGTPICPHCGQVMVTDDGQAFSCPDAAILNRLIADDLARVLAQWAPEATS